MKLKLFAQLSCGAVAVTGTALANTTIRSFAEDGIQVNNTVISANVESSCTLSSDVTSPHNATIENGTNKTDIGSTTLKVVCNDGEGWAIYAVGYSNEKGVGDTDMHSNNNAADIIPTGLATSGANSNWSMKLSVVAGTYAPTLDYAGSYALIPSTSTKVAHRDTNTDQVEGSSIKSTYQAYVSPTQNAGTYVGKVKYMLAHPKHETGGLSSLLYMQDMSPAVCEDTITGAMTTLMDSRDGKEYYVAKLKDGNCWMVDNLRYAGLDSEGNKHTATSSDTDTTNSFSLIDSTPSGTPYTTATNWTTKYDKSEYYPDETKSGEQYYGYLYNWYAASAGTTGNNNNDATASICPKGWTLPHNYNAQNPDKTYSNLLYKYGIIANITDSGLAYPTGKSVNDLVNAPLRFIRAGDHNNSGTSVNSRGSYGYYWSSTHSSTTYAYYLLFNGSNVYPQNLNDKTYGLSVRCVAR